MTTPRSDDPLYQMACAEAATEQGLDPIVNVLRAEGYPVEVEQAGGFTMVATIRDKADSMLGITCDGGEASDLQYLVVKYPPGAWDNGELGDWIVQEASLVTAVTVIRTSLSGHPQ